MNRALFPYGDSFRPPFFPPLFAGSGRRLTECDGDDAAVHGFDLIGIATEVANNPTRNRSAVASGPRATLARDQQSHGLLLSKGNGHCVLIAAKCDTAQCGKGNERVFPSFRPQCIFYDLKEGHVTKHSNILENIRMFCLRCYSNFF